jgi:hypothetical protein
MLNYVPSLGSVVTAADATDPIRRRAGADACRESKMQRAATEVARVGLPHPVGRLQRPSRAEVIVPFGVSDVRFSIRKCVVCRQNVE